MLQNHTVCETTQSTESMSLSFLFNFQLVHTM